MYERKWLLGPGFTKQVFVDPVPVICRVVHPQFAFPEGGPAARGSQPPQGLGKLVEEKKANGRAYKGNQE